MLPISIGSTQLIPGSKPDPDAGKSANIFCSCLTSGLPRFGLRIGYWEPFALVDVTRKNFCMVNLGMQLNISDLGLGGKQPPSEEGNGSFYHVHWYKYPLMAWLNIISATQCMEGGSFDVAYLSELDPTWSDDELAFVFNPEASLFAHPIPQMSCAADATKSMVGLPLDSLFWCQGSQGSTYPLTGHVTNEVSPISASLLLVERTNFKLHRLNLILESDIGSQFNICTPMPSSILPKSRYRYQMTNTIAEAKSCHPFGQSTMTWETGHRTPGSNDNFGYMVWRKRNCCYF
jgi:conjugal transfer pilus assembly protein TraU